MQICAKRLEEEEEAGLPVLWTSQELQAGGVEEEGVGPSLGALRLSCDALADSSDVMTAQYGGLEAEPLQWRSLDEDALFSGIPLEEESVYRDITDSPHGAMGMPLEGGERGAMPTALSLDEMPLFRSCEFASFADDDRMGYSGGEGRCWEQETSMEEDLAMSGAPVYRSFSAESVASSGDGKPSAAAAAEEDTGDGSHNTTAGSSRQVARGEMSIHSNYVHIW